MEIKILFAGDSITNGKLGESYVDIIGKSDPNYQVTNLGKDGATYNLIMKRLADFLKTNNSFDYVVLQGGYNDLLLPTFKNRGPLFKFAYKNQVKHNHIPLKLETEAFAYLTDSIRQIKQLFKGKIILVKLGCLGENLNSVLNQRRKELNKIIESVAVNEHIMSTNTDILFDNFLQMKQQSAYCLDNFWAVTLIDKVTNMLTAKRGLHLTIDGVHLAAKGAEFFAGSVLDKLDQQTDTRKHSSAIQVKKE